VREPEPWPFLALRQDVALAQFFDEAVRQRFRIGIDL
jgi:hypothetical protein